MKPQQVQKILVVDDDENFLELVRIRLEISGYEVITAADGDEALEKTTQELPDLAIVDLRLGQTDGISLMGQLHAINPYLPIIILTAHGSIESAVDAVKKGAYNFLNKPFDPEELLLQVEKALENRRLVAEVRRLEGLLEDKYHFKNIIARSEKMRLILDLVARVAPTDSTIFISGESGTGKELIARAVHLASDRKDEPFVTVNCAAIPETLLESELFGYEKGAFTDAKKTHKGMFLRADTGTIFLDEIGDMPLAIQAKLLRVLQEKKVTPLGSGKPNDIDVRVITATNKNIKEMIKKGAFREDLYYRIHVVPIEIPPLRERKEDVPLLAERFLGEVSQRMKKDVKSISDMAMQKLMLYDWPGNVRELENTIEHAVAVTSENIIGEELILSAKDLPAESFLPYKKAVDDFKKGYIVRLLEFTRGNVTKAAKLADKYRPDFSNLVQKYNIKPSDFKKRDK